jgi:hypothetical protein
MELNPDFKEFIGLLNLNNVEYIVVGGYAVGFHGHPRYTGDIDFWIAISKENAQKVMKVFEAFGFGHLSIQVEDLLNEDLIIQLGYEPNRIDILTSVTGLNFKECFNSRIVANFDEFYLNFIDLRSLRKNKAATGRAKDLGDLENLKD